jgi:hypothetical protein
MQDGIVYFMHIGKDNALVCVVNVYGDLAQDAAADVGGHWAAACRVRNMRPTALCSPGLPALL